MTAIFTFLKEKANLVFYVFGLLTVLSLSALAHLTWQDYQKTKQDLKTTEENLRIEGDNNLQLKKLIEQMEKQRQLDEKTIQSLKEEQGMLSDTLQQIAKDSKVRVQKIKDGYKALPATPENFAKMTDEVSAERFARLWKAFCPTKNGECQE